MIDEPRNPFWLSGNNTYAIEQRHGEWRCWLGGDKHPCESLEDGKAKAEAHYRSALFGEQGPLEPLEVQP